MENCPQVILCFWVLVLFVSHQLVSYGNCFGSSSSSSSSCVEKERDALLKLKSSITNNQYPNDDTFPFSTWREGTDCCGSTRPEEGWDGVTCNSSTGRVVELHLYETIVGQRKLGSSDWYLNASLLLPFEELRFLSLDVESMRGLTDGEALKRLPKLSKLKLVLYNGDDLNKTIVPYLGAFKFLKHLQLSGEVYCSPLPIEGFTTLSRLEALEIGSLCYPTSRIAWPIHPVTEFMTNLKALSLAGSGLKDSQSIQGLCKLRNLQELDLSHNEFEGKIPSCIGNLTNLQALSLSGSVLNDSQSVQGLCNLRSLQELDLSYNEFEGKIPSCLGNLTNLQLLYLSNNRFSGKIPASLITGLTSLLYFSLAVNRFSGLFSLGSLAPLSMLKGFELSHNKLVVDQTGYLINSTIQLEVLGLSKCKLDSLDFLYGQHNLTQVDLSHNYLRGEFPSWLLKNNTRLRILNLKNNSFLGTFQLPLYSNNTAMQSFDISNNHIGGQLPVDIGTRFPNLYFLNFSRNYFQGSIPPSLSNMTMLTALDLSHNKLSGEISEQVVADLGSLMLLMLSNNNLSGRISFICFNLTSLRHLYLDNNYFTELEMHPAYSFNASGLQGLYVGDNCISGRIPRQIGDIPSLSTLILRGNRFVDEVPFELCKLSGLHYLDLSENSLSGLIPSCFNFTRLVHMHLEKNAFSGLIPTALLRSPSLISLNIRDNDIVGVIPSWIGRLSQLRMLLLKENNLRGHMPMELCQLKNISILDLSHNYLSGSLPPCIKNLTFGRSVLLTSDLYRIYDKGYLYIVPYFEFSQHESYLVRESRSIMDIIDIGDLMIEVKFMTKSITNSYKGDILNFMSGIDLSCNQLAGKIPLEMGRLSGLHSLNLSHNKFVGPIPATFRNLSQIESLDLSYNKLNGTIPVGLTELNFLSVFSVAHNNLSGQTPDMKSQFATFNESSYDNNPLLCGLPLKKNCTSTTPTNQALENAEDDDDDEDNLVSFYASFVGAYVVFLLGTLVILYFSSQRHAVCFFHIVDSWFVFHMYNLLKLLNLK